MPKVWPEPTAHLACFVSFCFNQNYSPATVTTYRSFLPYFFGYKTEVFFPSKTIPKNLDPSYKIDLDLWDCLGRIKLILQQNFKELV